MIYLYSIDNLLYVYYCITKVILLFFKYLQVSIIDSASSICVPSLMNTADVDQFEADNQQLIPLFPMNRVVKVN